MKYFLITLAILLFVGFSIVSALAGSYNNLVGLRESARTELSQVETQLQRRFDLVPNLVATVKGAMKQEQAVFGAIAEARTKYAGAPAGSSEKLQAANQYESALGRLLVVMENYPQLQSIGTVKDLMVSLEGTENRIGVARQRYNENVKGYNQTLQTFPTNIIGGMFGFTQMSRFESVDEAKVAPVVNFEK